jgi:hypothetical protein
MSKAIILSMRVPVETRRTAGGVVASCKLLSLSKTACSIDEALSALTEALATRLESCFEFGHFDQLFHCNEYTAGMVNPPPGNGRYVDVRLTLSAPDTVLTATGFDGGI